MNTDSDIVAKLLLFRLRHGVCNLANNSDNDRVLMEAPAIINVGFVCIRHAKLRHLALRVGDLDSSWYVVYSKE